MKLRRNIQKNSSGCKARLALNTNTDLICMCKNDHSHEIDVIETAARQVCSDISSKSSSSESMKRIIAQVFEVYPNSEYISYRLQMLRPSKVVTSDEKPLNTHTNHRMLVSSYPHPQLGCNTEAAVFFTIR